MTDLLAQIMHTTDPRDFPPMAAVDHVALAPRPITIWRIESKDPDETREITGVLHSETDEQFNLFMVGEGHVIAYPKFTPSGVKVWRRA